MKIINSTQIPNYIIHFICKGTFSQIETKVILAICRQTIGWNKETDWITFKRFKQLTDMSESLLSRSIKQLIKKGVIVREGENNDVYSLSDENSFIEDYENYLKRNIKIEFTTRKGFKSFIYRNTFPAREDVKEYFLSLQNEKCFYCDKKIVKYEREDDKKFRESLEGASWTDAWEKPILRLLAQYDHFIPISEGGQDTAENCVISCPECNASKLSKMPADFFKEIGKEFKEPPILDIIREKEGLLKVNTLFTKSTQELTKSTFDLYTKESTTKEKKYIDKLDDQKATEVANKLVEIYEQNISEVRLKSKFVSKMKELLKEFHALDLEKIIISKGEDDWFMKNLSKKGPTWFFSNKTRLERYLDEL